MIYMRNDSKDTIVDDPDRPFPFQECEVKEIWLRNLSNKEHFRIAAAYEFFSDTCALWNRNGITCFEVMESKQ